MTLSSDPQQPLPQHSHHRRPLRLPRLPQEVQGVHQVGRAQEKVHRGSKVRIQQFRHFAERKSNISLE